MDKSDLKMAAEMMEKFSALLIEREKNPNLSMTERLRIVDLTVALVAYMDLLLDVDEAQVTYLRPTKTLN